MLTQPQGTSRRRNCYMKTHTHREELSTCRSRREEGQDGRPKQIRRPKQKKEIETAIEKRLELRLELKTQLKLDCTM